MSTETWRIDPTHEYKMVAYLRGFQFNTSRSPTFDLDVEVTLLDHKRYLLNYTSNSKTQTILAMAVVVVFDITYANTLDPANINVGVFTIENSKPVVIPSDSYVQNNKYVGFAAIKGFVTQRNREMFYDPVTRTTSSTYMLMHIAYFMAGTAFC